MDRYVIPARLDEPERIGLWTLDEFAASRSRSWSAS
jgi:conjugal transfer pilus assembly protein TraL